jgi:putative hydrolase of the HAD superfamily
MKYKAVIFDLFGTLVDIFSLREYEAILEKMAAYLKAPYADFHNVWMQTAKMRTTGTLTTLEENLKYICQELKISVSPKQLEAARHVRFNYVKRALKPRKDAIKTLSRLKADGFKIGLISNCSTEPPIIWPNTPFAPYFNVAIFSSVACLLKPDPRIFKIATKQLNVTPQKCLYVGDGGDKELAAAASVGMTPVLIRATHEDSSDALRPNDEGIKDFTGIRITSLKEVLNLVK